MKSNPSMPSTYRPILNLLASFFPAMLNITLKAKLISSATKININPNIKICKNISAPLCVNCGKNNAKKSSALGFKRLFNMPIKKSCAPLLFTDCKGAALCTPCVYHCRINLSPNHKKYSGATFNALF